MKIADILLINILLVFLIIWVCVRAGITTRVACIIKSSMFRTYQEKQPEFEASTFVA